MPSKSQHSRGKHSHQSKKSKSIQRREAWAARPPINEKAAPVVEAATVPAPKPVEIPSRQHAVSHPYISGELKKIGVIAAIMFIILIILAVVLP